MAVPSNTSLTYSAVGIREDLSNVIYNIAPLDTPFFSGCGRSTADSTKFEWQTDTIAAGTANQAIEGNDPTNDARANPVLLNNYTQISVYTIQTSGTNEAVDYAGRKNSQAYQLAKKAKQMKRDIEYMLTNNVVKAVGDSTEARKSAGISTWLNTGYFSNNATSGSPAAGNLGTLAPVDATATASITEANMRTVIKKVYEAGGDPDVILCKPAIKQAISDLAQSVSSLRTDTKGDSPAHVIAAVDVYVSDFGTFKIVSDRNQFREKDVFFIDFDYWSVAYLRPFKTEALAKSGDSVRQMLVVEYGLESKNQASSGFLADCKA
tara:strand:+ start:2935 stop:3900 length:966 start_codon:yes stop_codon:yes gene_type:complete